MNPGEGLKMWGDGGEEKAAVGVWFDQVFLLLHLPLVGVTKSSPTRHASFHRASNILVTATPPLVSITIPPFYPSPSFLETPLGDEQKDHITNFVLWASPRCCLISLQF